MLLDGTTYNAALSMQIVSHPEAPYGDFTPSITTDPQGKHAIITWMDTGANLFYLAMDENGTLITTPTLLLNSTAGIKSSATGFGNARFTPYLQYVTPAFYSRVFFEGPNEVEPNDTRETANGPLRSGTTYTGLHYHADGTEDENDRFYVILDAPGKIKATLTNFYGDHPNFMLQDDNPLHASLISIPDFLNHTATFTSGVLPAGKYYIRTNSPSGGSSTQVYTLKVIFPAP